MNKMEAYSKLFSINDSELDKKYYVRLLSMSENEVPKEVVDYIESFELSNDESDIIVDGTDKIKEISDIGNSDDTVTVDVNNQEPNEKVADELTDISKITNVILDSDIIAVEEQEPTKEVLSNIPIIEVEDQSIEEVRIPNESFTIEIEEQQDTKETTDNSDSTTDEISNQVIDPMNILKDFYDHLKKASVYRKIRNSDNPDNLCKSVSSFCTRYLIELHSSNFDSELVRSAVAKKVSVGGILRLLANYVEFGDLNSLAKSVIIIRNFLDELDKEFVDTAN